MQREPIHRPEHAAQWLDETLAGLGLDRAHLVGWLLRRPARPEPGTSGPSASPRSRCSTPAAWRRRVCASAGLRFVVWILASLFATFAPKVFRPRLAAWLDQPVLVVPELRAMVGTAGRAYRIRRPAPLPLSEEELSTIRTPLYLVLGQRSLLVHPQRQAERVPRLIPGARAEIISSTGHGP
ncbi:Carboxylesterase YbfK [Streptomyces sp. MA5143a]|nr:Carboxylesterase YbfK [Streptomyces sp. MA5143a]